MILVSVTLMNSARTSWSKIFPLPLTEDVMGNKTDFSPPVCLSLCSWKVEGCDSGRVSAEPLPLTYFPLCDYLSSGATLIRVLSALLRPNPCICSVLAGSPRSNQSTAESDQERMESCSSTPLQTLVIYYAHILLNTFQTKSAEVYKLSLSHWTHWRTII